MSEPTVMARCCSVPVLPAGMLNTVAWAISSTSASADPATFFRRMEKVRGRGAGRGDEVTYQEGLVLVWVIRDVGRGGEGGVVSFAVGLMRCGLYDRLCRSIRPTGEVG